jgi:acetate---CoA ligase (ADP-forming) subunit alpha
MNTITIKEALDAAFEPKSIAIIGASNDMSKLGAADLRKLVNFGYKGKIYPVNAKEDIVQGLKAYKSILDIPFPVDRAVVVLPSKFVPQIVKDCAQKGVKAVQIYSAGFGEMGEEGKELEKEMIKNAKQYGMRIIGPNCIGTYCPTGGISFTKVKDPIEGSVAFISQSGGIAYDIVGNGDVRGIYYSKVISVGNCIDLDHSDYIEYLANDPSTKIIGMYLESIRDGMRFMEAIKKTTPHKPVVILKGGRTKSGNLSAASHTGNLAGNYEIWEALFRQTGAIPVRSLDEMYTVLLCLQNLQLNPSNKIAMVGNGGGATVLGTDVCEEVGLEFVPLSDQSCHNLYELGVGESGRNINPIDLPVRSLATNNGKRFSNILQILCEDKNVAHILFHINLIPFSNSLDLYDILQKMFSDLANYDRKNTNIVAVLRTNGDPDLEKAKVEISKSFLQSTGIPVFSTIEQALYGISITVRHSQRVSGGEMNEINGFSTQGAK